MRDAAAARSLPAVALLAATAVLAWAETGSIDAADWLLYAILAALLLALVLAVGVAAVPPRAALVGLGALVLLAVWQAISAAWSPLPSFARDDALLTLFYVAAFAVALLTVRGHTEGLIVIAAVAALGGGLAVATALAIRYGSDPSTYFVGDGRLAWPVTYPNGDAAIFLIGLWPAIVLAAERRLPSLLRGLALGTATGALAAWLLTQSKGGGVGLAASAIVVFAVTPQRLRLLVPAAIAAALVGPQFGPLTAPFNAGNGFAEVARHGAFTLLWLVAAAIAAGTAYAVLDRRIDVSERTRRIAQVAVAALVVAAAVAAVAAFFASVDHPRGFAADKWDAFKHLPRTEQAQTHFVSLGSNRYDFWRVALLEFRDHPLAGIGARGFGPAYLVEGRSSETPARAHSVELDALSELGVPGLLLLVAGLGGPLVVCFRRLRVREPTATAAFAAAAYWVVHASGDWNWTIPALGLPFFVLLGAGAAGRAGSLRPAVAWAAAGLAVAVAVLAFAPSWLSARLSGQALESSASRATDLRWARRLDPLSVEPYFVEAQTAPTAAAALSPLRKAVEKEPRSAEARYELGLAYARAGRRRLARAELRQALALSPRAEEIRAALRRVQVH
ncbi:MAG: O-antigen ligase family protein [Gaiellaceae bacterium]